MALQKLSMSVGRLEPRHPVRHMIALRRRAKLILVCMYVIASEYVVVVVGVFTVGALGCKTFQFSFGTSFFIGLQIPQLHGSLQVQLSSSL